MSYIYADQKKQVAVVNTSSPANASSLMITGSIDLLNHTSVTGLANATLIGNLKEAANLIYPTSRGSLTYYNGLVIEGLPHVAISPEMGTFDGTIRNKGVGIGLGYTVSNSTRLYNRPGAVLDIFGTNADIRVIGGGLSAAGTASLIMAGSKANNGFKNGFKFDVSRTETNNEIDDAVLYLRPYDSVTSSLPALLTVTLDGNVGVGTTTPTSLMDIQASTLSAAALHVVNSGDGVLIETTTSVGAPFKINRLGNPLLTATSDGRVGIGTDPTGLSSNNNYGLYVNGPIKSDNSIFAYGTFGFNGSSTFEKKDVFNVDSVTCGITLPSIAPIVMRVNFIDGVTGFDSATGYTVVVSETSDNSIKAYVSEKTEQYVSFQFRNITTNSPGLFSEFSFMIFYNSNSTYSTVSALSLPLP